MNCPARNPSRRAGTGDSSRVTCTSGWPFTGDDHGFALQGAFDQVGQVFSGVEEIDSVHGSLPHRLDALPPDRCGVWKQAPDQPAVITIFGAAIASFIATR